MDNLILYIIIIIFVIISIVMIILYVIEINKKFVCDTKKICTEIICNDMYPCKCPQTCYYIEPTILSFDNKAIRTYNGLYLDPNNINKASNFQYLWSYDNINYNLSSITKDGIKLCLRFPGNMPTYAQTYPCENINIEKIIYDGYNFYLKGPLKIKTNTNPDIFIDYEFGKNDFVIQIIPIFNPTTLDISLSTTLVNKYSVGRKITLDPLYVESL